MIQPKPCSVLSLDVGDKRIGIAGCDPLGISINISLQFLEIALKKI